MSLEAESGEAARLLGAALGLHAARPNALAASSAGCAPCSRPLTSLDTLDDAASLLGFTPWLGR